MVLNLRTLYTFASLAGVSARATALDSPSSGQVREACLNFLRGELVWFVILFGVILVVRYTANRMARD